MLKDLHKNKKFDYIIANPPFNSANWFDGNIAFHDDRWRFGVPPRSNANFAWLEHIVSHLGSNGRSAVLMPNGTLTTQIHQEVCIRKEMIKSNLVEAIIVLPPGLFSSTKVSCCIWLLTNSNREKRDILFVNAAFMKPAIKKEITSVHMEQLKELADKHRQGKLYANTDWYGTASLDAIEKNDFQLSPNQYIAVLRPLASEIRRDYEKLVKTMDALFALPFSEKILCSIALWKNAKISSSWKRLSLPEMYHIFGGLTKSRASFDGGFPLLDVKTVIHDCYVPDCFSSSVDVTEKEKVKYNIKYGDVFLNRTSETGKELACCCVALKDQNAVYSGFIKRLRPLGGHVIDPLYAACYFRSEIYRWEVEKVSTEYTTRVNIDNKKLSKIFVYFPDMETQKKIGRTMFEIFQFQKQCSDRLQKKLLEEFERLLIQQYITYPVLCMQSKDGDDTCR